jgi:hypothetical protein
MKSNVFARHRMPGPNYNVTAELDDAGNPALSFRSPDGLWRLDMTGASQLRNSMDLVGEHQNATDVSRLINAAQHLRRVS